MPDFRHSTSIPRGWRTLVICAAAYALGMCVYLPMRAETGTDFRDYWQTARNFLDTGEISAELGVHNYLPFFTIFMTPWAMMPISVAIVLFNIMSLALLAVTFVMMETLLAGRLGERPRAALLGGVILLLPYAHSSATLGTVNLLVLFLVIATWFLIERGRAWEAGLPLGLAIAVKLMPAALLPFLIIVGRWRAALVATLILVVLGLGIPLAALGPQRWMEQHRAFYERAIVGHSAQTTITSDQPRKAVYSNTSLPIVLRRLLTPLDADPNEGRPPMFVNIADLPRSTVWIIYCVLLIGIGVATVLATLGETGRPSLWIDDSAEARRERERESARFGPRSGRRSVWRERFEHWAHPLEGPIFAATRAKFGAWCCLMVLTSPLVWTHYYVLLAWPLAVAADQLQSVWRREERVCRASALVVAGWILGIVALALPNARAMGAQLAAALCAWIGMLILSQTLRPKPPAPTEPE